MPGTMPSWVPPAANQPVHRTVLVNPNEKPLPPTEVRRRLRQISTQLDLEYFAGRDGYNWALTWKWPQSDPRWRSVRRGETDPAKAKDILTFLPPEVSVDEAAAFVLKSIRTATTPAVRDLLNHIHKWNFEQEEINAKPVMDQAFNEIEERSRTLFADTLGEVPFSAGGIPGALTEDEEAELVLLEAQEKRRKLERLRAAARADAEQQAGTAAAIAIAEAVTGRNLETLPNGDMSESPNPETPAAVAPTPGKPATAPRPPRTR